MVILQIDSDQFDTAIENAVRKALASLQPAQVLTHTEPGEFLTVRQAADFLDLTPASIYGLVHNGKIPGACRRGKRLYFLRQELLDWIKAGRKATAAEIDARAETYAHTRKKR